MPKISIAVKKGPPPVPFFYDEFDNQSVDPRWTSDGVGAGSISETNNDRLEIWKSQSGGGGVWSAYQDFNEYFDVWSLVEIPTKNTSGAISDVLRVEDLTSGHEAEVRLLTGDGNLEYDIRGDWDDTINNNFDQIDNVSVVGNQAWLRLRYRAGDSKIRLFYALSLPGVWTELTPGVAAPVLASGAYRFSLSNDNTQTISRTTYFYNATEIPE